MSTDHPADANAPVEPAPAGGLRGAWRLLYRAAVAWDRDDAMRLSAAVAMYTILSLSPLLVITIKATALVLSEEAAARQVRRQAAAFLGPVGAQAVEGMIADTVRPGAGVLATTVSAAVLLFLASGVFYELRGALNAIWGIVPLPTAGYWATVRKRLLSVGMVFAVGFLLLVSQAVSTALAAAGEFALGEAGWVGVAVDLVVSTAVVAALFGLIFRYLPDARLTWRQVAFGAGVTAVLFKLGQYAQALYFKYGTTASTYGAAGSFVVVLLWVYYSCWVLFYGAELIRERARLRGREVAPDAHAERVARPAGEPVVVRPEQRGAE